MLATPLFAWYTDSVPSNAISFHFHVCASSSTQDQLKDQLKDQLEDKFDTLREQAQLSQSRSEERSSEALRRSVAAGAARACVAQRELLKTRERLSSAEGALAEAERRAKAEEFLKLAQEAACLRAHEECAQQKQETESLAEELQTAREYAAGLRALVVAWEEQDGVGMGGREGARVVVEQDRVGAESREVVAGGNPMCREIMDEYEGAVDRAEGLEQMVEKHVANEDRLMEDIHGLRNRIEELEVNAHLALFTF